MADNSKIEWTDATVNFWWGCTKVGPGCDHCYAEALDKRIGGNHWGRGAVRRRIKGAVSAVARLDRTADKWFARHGRRRRVFIQSMADLFDLEAPLEWFEEAWEAIVGYDRLDLQILTKRISAVEKRLAAIGLDTWPAHAGLMITVVDQNEAARDIPRLLDLKARWDIPWVGISAEPLLGGIDFGDWLGADHPHGPWQATELLSWIIVGGESGPNARPMHPDWARSIRDQCQAAGVPFFFKQWGEWAPWDGDCWECPDGWDDVELRYRARIVDDLRFVRVGKKRAGACLDGREWRESPPTDRHRNAR